MSISSKEIFLKFTVTKVPTYLVFTIGIGTEGCTTVPMIFNNLPYGVDCKAMTVEWNLILNVLDIPANISIYLKYFIKMKFPQQGEILNYNQLCIRGSVQTLISIWKIEVFPYNVDSGKPISTFITLNH